MNDWCNRLKEKLEKAFSMPFDVSKTTLDGEDVYLCNPANEDNLFFVIKAYVHNQIRLVVEIYPQNNASAILTEMSAANKNKQEVFFQYIDVLCNAGAKVQFYVNDELLSPNMEWPLLWRYFRCRINILPIPEFSSEEGILSLIAEWMMNGTALIFSLLTIVDVVDDFVPQSEGEAKEIKSKRYERSRINRDICLAHKGYSCHVCGFNFLEIYGELGKDYIQVHHTMPVSQMGSNYEINIDRDLVPVCSNCHSMIHRRTPPYTIKELKDIISQNGGKVYHDINDNDLHKNEILSMYTPNCIPLYSLRAACGRFSGEEEPEVEGWVDVSGHGFTPDKDKYFAVHAKGHSMSPDIKDGDICVFEWYNKMGGSREGNVVLVYSEEKLSDGSTYTIKKYHSEKDPNADSWQHKRIVLVPINPDFEPIELQEDQKVYTVGVLKCVL
jgi:5-methylcytosine-specific restriction protein A